MTNFEIALISCLLTRPEYADAVKLSENDFSTALSAALFKVVKASVNPTHVVVTEELAKMGVQPDAAILSKLFAVKPDVADLEEIEKYAEEVRKEAVCRRLQRKLLSASDLLREGKLDEATTLASGALLRVTDEMVTSEDATLQGILGRMASGEGLAESFPMGLTQIDAATGGLRHGNIAVITAGYKKRKCLGRNTQVYADGVLVRIDEILPPNLPEGFTATSINLLGRTERETASHFYRSPAGRTITVRTKRGLTLTGTPDHPILLLEPDGTETFRPLSDVSVGEWVSSRKGMNEFPATDQVDPTTASVMGYLVGDGSVTTDGAIGFTNPDQELIEDYESKCVALGFKAIQHNGLEHRIYCTKDRAYLAELGLGYGTAGYKEVPLSVRASGRASQIAFLRSYFDCDGWVSPSNHTGVEVMVLSKSLRLIEQVQMMLQNLGILSTRRESWVKYQGERRLFWELSMSSEDALSYARQIGFLHKKKHAKLAAYVEAAPNIRARRALDIIPISQDILIDLAARNPGLRSVFNRTISRGIPCRLTRARAKRLVEATGDELLASLADDTRFYDEIVSVEEGPEIETFDFTVPGSHAFWSNGMISHNTTVALHIVKTVLEQGRSVAYVALEDDDVSFAQRLMGMAVNCPSDWFDIPAHRRIPQMQQKVDAGLDWAKDKKFRVYDAKDGVHHFPTALALMRADKLKFDTDLVVADFLQAWDERFEELTDITQKLAKFALETRVALLELSQISGETMKNGPIKGYLASKGTQAIGQLCHLGMELRYDESRPSPSHQGPVTDPKQHGSISEIGVHLKVARKAPSTWDFLIIEPSTGMVVEQNPYPTFPSKPGALD